MARSLSAKAFGAFSVAYATYILALAVIRGLTGEPLAVRYSGLDSDWRAGTRNATGAAVAAGIAAALICAAVAVGLDPIQRSTVLALAVALPALLLQDTWRFAFFARRTPAAAFVNDLIWALVLFPGLLVLLVASDHGGPAVFVLVWGGAGLVAAIAGSLQSGGIVPVPTRVGEWLRQQHGLAVRYVIEGVASHGAFQVTLYALAAFAGLAAAGALRAGLIAFGPALVFLQGSRLVAVPEGMRLLHRSPERFRAATTRLSGALAVGALAWGMIVLLIPERVGVALLGASWSGARSVALPLVLVMTSLALEMGAVIGLRVLAAARQSLRARLVEAVLAVTAGSAGAAIAGASGTAWFLAVAFVIAAAFWWRQFLKALREHSTEVPEADAVTPEGTGPQTIGP